MRNISLKTMDGQAEELAKSKKSLSFAFAASSFSLKSSTSRSEQKVPRSLRSIIQKPGAAHQRRFSDSVLLAGPPSAGAQRRASEPHERPAMVERRGSVPSVFVNPPTFALARGKKEGSVRPTMGVPMISIAEDTSKKSNASPVGYKVNKAGNRGSQRGRFGVSPPAMSVTKGGTSRARKTLGVPMV